MNADRRIVGKVLIELLVEGDHHGSISDQAHALIGETLLHLQKSEYHQLRAQEKFEGKNASTDKQIAICRVALPALEAAVQAYNGDDFVQCITEVKLAIETDGTVAKPKRKGKRRA